MKDKKLAEALRVRALEAQVARLQKKTASSEVGELKRRILALSKRQSESGRWTLLALAQKLNARPAELEEAVALLRDEGFNIRMTEGVVHHSQVSPSGGKSTHLSRLVDGGWVRFGVLGDNQLGNRHSRLDVAETAYDHFKREGIDTVYHTGNIIDGYVQRINGYELLPEAGTTLEAQAAYAGRVYPQREGIKTYFVTGECHEGWYAKQIGVNVGQVMEDRFRLPETCREIEYSSPQVDQFGRPLALGARCRNTIKDGTCSKHGRRDLVYLGYEEADIELRTSRLDAKMRGPVVRILHPGGGSSYAISYKTQKLAESLQGGEQPQIQLVGHFHKYDVNYHREIVNVQTGCLCDQTLFMRKNMLAAHVGYLIMAVFIAQDGSPQRVRHEWVPFYDRGFYQKF